MAENYQFKCDLHVNIVCVNIFVLHVFSFNEKVLKALILADQSQTRLCLDWSEAFLVYT